MMRPARSEWLGPPFAAPARRVVSLVPSLTDAVFRLDSGRLLVGRTEYCVRPAGEVDTVPVVGGTKNADPERVAALDPDVVLACREENTRSRIMRIAERYPVWLTDPRGPADVPALWKGLGEILGSPRGAERAAAVAATLERLVQRPTATRRPRVLYLIWKDPWMAVGRETYIGGLLDAADLDNALPDAPDTARYPRLEPDDLVVLRPDAYLLSSEPYSFRIPGDLGPLAGLVVGPFGDSGVRLDGGAVAVEVDGMVLSWYPSHTLDGLETACRLRDRIAAATETEAQPRDV